MKIHQETWYREALDRSLPRLVKDFGRGSPGSAEEWIKEALRRSVPPELPTPGLKTLLYKHPILVNLYEDCLASGKGPYPEWLWPYYWRWLTSDYKTIRGNIKGVLSVCPEKYLPRIKYDYRFEVRNTTIGELGNDFTTEEIRGEVLPDGTFTRTINRNLFEVNAQEFINSARGPLVNKAWYRPGRTPSVNMDTKWRSGEDSNYHWSLVVTSWIANTLGHIPTENEVAQELEEIYTLGYVDQYFYRGALLEEEYHHITIEEVHFPGYTETGLDNHVMYTVWENTLLELINGEL